MNFSIGDKLLITAPVVNMKKGTHKELLKQFVREGFLKAYINKEVKNLTESFELDKNKKHKIDLIIDRIVITKTKNTRLVESIELALKVGNGLIKVIDSK